MNTDEKDNNVEISLTGAITFTGKISLQKASKILSVVTMNEEAVYEQQNFTQSTKPRSVREYLSEKLPKTSTQKILVFASYLEEVKNKDEFSSSDVKDLFQLAREPLPKNLARDIRETERSSWIAEKGVGSYYLTGTGQEFLDSGFPSQKTTNIRRKKVKTSKKTNSSSSVRSEVLKLEMTPKVEGLPDYWSIPKSGRILWILQVAKDNSLPELTHKEVEKVSNKLDDNIPQKSVTSLTIKSKKQGYLVTSERNGLKTLKLIKPGSEYVKNKLHGGDAGGQAVP